mmetsp:Transcript_39147/g.92103  ORF Transcript_39147/g.92103 Transcript_39147/m.92103 type:complete len:204 (-) Transcript_39147:321-932(-)
MKLLLVNDAIAVAVMRVHELGGFLALQGLDTIEGRHIPQIKDGDDPIPIDIEEVEGVVLQFLAVAGDGGEVHHQVVEELLHFVDGDAEGFHGALELVSERNEPLTYFLQGGPQDAEQLLDCLLQLLGVLLHLGPNSISDTLLRARQSSAGHFIEQGTGGIISGLTNDHEHGVHLFLHRENLLRRTGQLGCDIGHARIELTVQG